MGASARTESRDRGPEGARSDAVSALGAGPSDAELVERARSGDRWAQEAIFRRYVATVTRLSRRLLARSADADDVVQDTFAAALTKLHQLGDPNALRSWLLGIAVHRVRRRHRKRKLLRALGLDRGLTDSTLELLAAPTTSPETLVELRCIDALIARLPTEERLAWMLRYVEGETLEEVARITGCSLATAKRRIASVQLRVDAALTREGAR